MKKFIISCIVFFVLVSFYPVTSAKGKTEEVNEDDIVIISEDYPERGTGSQTIVLPEDPMGSVGTRSLDYEERYKRTFYNITSEVLTATDVGGLTDNTFIIAVARGSIKSTIKTHEVSGTVTVSGSVTGGLKGFLETEYTGSLSGTYTYTIVRGSVYNGPSESSSSSYRSYYAAIAYDQYSTVTETFHVYEVYEFGIKTGEKTYYVGESLNSVLAPKGVEYSVDSPN